MESPTKEFYTNIIDGKSKVMIGGAPITKSYATQMGADGYLPDAGQTIAIARWSI